MRAPKANAELRPEIVVRLAGDAPVPPDVELEAELHADVIDAVRQGWLTLDPDGALTATTGAPAGFDAPVTTGGKVAALRALGVDLAPVPSALRWRARQVLEVLEMVAGSNEAPPEWQARAQTVIDAWLCGARTGVEPWMLALEAVMATTAPTEQGRALTSSDPVEAAKQVLERLQASCPDVPQPLRRPPQARLRSAGATLLAARVRRSGKTGGRGALISPWAAARDFANALGVSMPDRASKTQRENKSSRRRNTAR